jgi:Raf kinase inhibitor-like YbhB/YbcL family protein
MKEDFLMSIKLSSGAFDDGGLVPVKYTCDGEDISPSLSWSELPDGTRSLALIMDDPDAPAGTWVHWILYDLPPYSVRLDENMARTEDVPGGGSQGNNSWNRLGYGGPCPPSGTHRYIFRLYALDSALDLGPGAEKADLVQAMEGHVLDRGQLLGLYSR